MRDWLFNIKDYTKKIFNKIYEFIIEKAFGIYNGTHLIFPFLRLLTKFLIVAETLLLLIGLPIFLMIEFGISFDTLLLYFENILNIFLLIRYIIYFLMLKFFDALCDLDEKVNSK